MRVCGYVSGNGACGDGGFDVKSEVVREPQIAWNQGVLRMLFSIRDRPGIPFLLSLQQG